MSSGTWHYVEEVLALSPWIAFLVAIAGSWLLLLLDSRRASRVHECPRRRDTRAVTERRPSTKT